jgi:Peptidase S24-like
MARRLGIPVRTWYNYEGGVTVPAEVILKIIELTSVEAVWLLHGEEPKFRHLLTERGEMGGQPNVTVGALLRTALQLLEKDESAWSSREETLAGPDHFEGAMTGVDHFALTYDSMTPAHPENLESADRLGDEAGSRFSQSRREWLAAQRDNRCIQVNGDSMSPILADGAAVAYAKSEEEMQQLDGKMVVTWVDNQPLVRWFQHCGRFALLRAENPNTVPQQVLVDLEDPKQRPRFRRVVGFNSPH